MSAFLKRDRTQSQDTPLLWLGVLIGSLALHLVVLLIGRWYLAQPSKSSSGGNPGAIEFVEIDPNAPAQSRPVAPAKTASAEPLPKSQAPAGNSPEPSTFAQSQATQTPAQQETQATVTPRLEAPPQPQTSATPKSQPRSQPPQQREPEKPPTQPTNNNQPSSPPSEEPKPSDSSNSSTLPPGQSGSTPDNSTTPPNPDNSGLQNPTNPNPSDSTKPSQPGNPLPAPNYGGDETPKDPGSSITPGDKLPIDSNPAPAVTGFSTTLGQGKLGADVVDRPEHLAQPTETARTIEVTSLPGDCSLTSEVISNNGQEIILRLTISQEGNVEGDPIVLSSVSPDYDALAKCVIKDWKFSPAYNISPDKQKNFVPSNLDLPIRLQISKP